MTIAVMQPYFFPYLGYFQLVRSVDKFVFFDDVNYIMKGWINRNRILVNHQPFKFTVPLIKASQNKAINELMLAEFPSWKIDFLKLLRNSYQKAPFFEDIYQWLQHILQAKEYVSISELAEASVIETSALLGIETQFLRSSELAYKTTGESINGQQKILRICKILSATRYHNPLNGAELYDDDVFLSNGIDLKFIAMDELAYPQFHASDFAPYLSIIDVLMFNSVSDTSKFLLKYQFTQKSKNEPI